MAIKRLKKIAKKNILKVTSLASTDVVPCDRCGAGMPAMVFFREIICL